MRTQIRPIARQSIASTLGVTVALVFGLAVSTPRADSSGRCLTVRVDAPVVLPDGKVREAAKLTLCNSVQVSPVAAGHKTYVDGMLVGLHLGRPRTSESHEAAPTVYFHRNGEGHLELLGYVFPSPGGDVTYTLGRAKEPRAPGTGPVLADQGQQTRQLVAVAAVAASR